LLGPSLFSFDEDFRTEGYSPLAGVDEVGRGALAGPVVAAAVILPGNLLIADLNDSKKISEKEREVLFKEIKKRALDYTIETINNKIIDRINILEATFLAMSRAVLKLKIKPNLSLIDGNHNVPSLSLFNQKPIISGDEKSATIAAASILAKVTRDRIMFKYAKNYKIYYFERNKGYGTKKHIEILKKYGVCPIHRLTFAPAKTLPSTQIKNRLSLTTEKYKSP
jgi:ribonuclease HII